MLHESQMVCRNTCKCNRMENETNLRKCPYIRYGGRRLASDAICIAVRIDIPLDNTFAYVHAYTFPSEHTARMDIN